MPDLGFLKDYWEIVVEAVRGHLSSILTGATAVLAALLAAWKARAIWKRRRFLDRVNFSLNYVDNGVLKLRTLRESDIREVLLSNKHGIDLVTAAAEHATLDEPFLKLPVEDSWMVLNSVLNEVSEQFAAGFLAASMGLCTRSTRYVIGLTCEKDPDVRINKIRVMLVTESLLQKIDRLEDLEFEQKHHHVRLKTLKKMAEIYQDQKRQHELRTVELVVPTGMTTVPRGD